MKDGRFPENLDWLAGLPLHWQTVRLKFALRAMKSGGTPATGKNEYWDGSIPWVSPKDMKSHDVADSADHVSTLALKDAGIPLLPPGHLLMVVRSGILRHSIPVAINSVPVTINQDLKALLCDEEILLPQFLMYVILGNQNVLLQRWRKPGTTVESLEYEYYSNDRIPLPPLPEQRAIVSFLTRHIEVLDQIIGRIGGKESTSVASPTSILGLLIEYRSALIANAVTGKIDVRNLVEDEAAA